MQHAHFLRAMKHILRCIAVLVAVLALAQIASGGGFGNKRGGKVSRMSNERRNVLNTVNMQRARATQCTYPTPHPPPPTNPLSRLEHSTRKCNDLQQ